MDGNIQIADPKPRIAIVAFSFAMRRKEEEPNPCNKRLGIAVDRTFNAILADGKGPAFIFDQWEIGLEVRSHDFTKEFREKYMAEVGLPRDGSYLDSEGVWAAAKKELRRRNIHEVVPIAQPFLHLSKIKSMIKADAPEFTLNLDYVKLIGKIGFDNDPRNLQPWTKSASALLLYAVNQKLFGAKGA